MKETQSLVKSESILKLPGGRSTGPRSWKLSPFMFSPITEDKGKI